MFIQRQRTNWEYTSLQHSKWVKDVKGMNKFAILSMYEHVPSKATYSLRIHQLQYSKCVKDAKEGMNFHSTQNSCNLEYA